MVDVVNNCGSIKSVIDFVYTHTDEDFVIVDCDILDEVYEDMKNKKRIILFCFRY